MASLTPDSAVQACYRDYYKTWEKYDPNYQGLSGEGWKSVCEAWRFAMPYLTSDPDSIDCFLACVTQGMLNGIFTMEEASKFLYAIQVAIGSRRARTEALKAQSKSQQPQ